MPLEGGRPVSNRGEGFGALRGASLRFRDALKRGWGFERVEVYAVRVVRCRSLTQQ